MSKRKWRNEWNSGQMRRKAEAVVCSFTCLLLNDAVVCNSDLVPLDTWIMSESAHCRLFGRGCAVFKVTNPVFS